MGRVRLFGSGLGHGFRFLHDGKVRPIGTGLKQHADSGPNTGVKWLMMIDKHRLLPIHHTRQAALGYVALTDW